MKLGLHARLSGEPRRRGLHFQRRNAFPCMATFKKKSHSRDTISKYMDTRRTNTPRKAPMIIAVKSNAFASLQGGLSSSPHRAGMRRHVGISGRDFISCEQNKCRECLQSVQLKLSPIHHFSRKRAASAHADPHLPQSVIETEDFNRGQIPSLPRR